MNGHRRIEERSIRLHGAVAAKLRRDPEVLARARERVRGWLADGAVHPHYARAWADLLATDTEEVAARLVDSSEAMRALRQCSPFAGALAPRERWEILREAREAEARGAGR